MDRLRRFHLVAEVRVQALGPGGVLIGTRHGPQRQVHEATVVDHVCLPEDVVVAPDGAQRQLQVVEGLGVATEQREGVGPSQSDPGQETPVGQLRGLVELCESFSGPACHYQRRAVCRSDIEHTVDETGPPGQAQRRPEVEQGGRQLSVVALNDAGGLMGDGPGQQVRVVVGDRTGVQKRTGGAPGARRVRYGQCQKLIGPDLR